MASADRLEAALKRAIDAGALDIWVDLTATEFMDSTGLNLLLALQRRLHELNRQLAIICPGGVIRRTFEVARLDTHLPLFAARSEAQRRR